VRELAILDAAEKLLAEGFEPVTVEQIAQGAGLTRAALYFYFGSKQEVLTALVARTMSVIVDEAHIAADEVDSPPRDTFARAVKRTEAQWLEHGVIMRAAVDYSPFIPAVGKLWRDTVETYIESAATVLIRAGIPDRDGPTGAHEIARALCWMTERSFYMAVTQAPPRPELSEISRTSLELWRMAIESF
jgi:AcrR family transcriptional regulator